MKYGRSVAACGLAGGPKLETTVIPFLLRGVNLLGIDSVMQPHENRVRTWQRIDRDLPLDKLDAKIGRASWRERSGSVRVDMWGRRINKKKKHTQSKESHKITHQEH